MRQFALLLSCSLALLLDSVRSACANRSVLTSTCASKEFLQVIEAQKFECDETEDWDMISAFVALGTLRRRVQMKDTLHACVAPCSMVYITYILYVLERVTLTCETLCNNLDAGVLCIPNLKAAIQTRLAVYALCITVPAFSSTELACPRGRSCANGTEISKTALLSPYNTEYSKQD